MEAKSRREGEGAQTCSNKCSHLCCQKSCSSLQAGRTYTALQAALSSSPPENLTEASHQVVLRAEAKVEAAALQLKIMQHLATPDYIK
eukprot:4479-Heterococcus_DN1.PRE.1